MKEKSTKVDEDQEKQQEIRELHKELKEKVVMFSLPDLVLLIIQVSLINGFTKIILPSELQKVILF